ncbi:MAG: hypothetical protein AB7N76_03495 [Planctomycetota bacterium]
MVRPATLRAALIAALIVGAVARAGDEPAAPQEPAQPPAAHRARVRWERTTRHVLQHRLSPDQPRPTEQRREVSYEAVYVRELVLGRGERVQTAELRFERWRRREGKRLDQSLEGRTVRFAPARPGQPLQAKLVEAKDAPPLSQAAQRYLEDQAHELSAPLAELVLPAARGTPPVRPLDAPWRPDPGPLCARLAPDAKLEAQRSRVAGKVQERAADAPWKLEVRGELQLTTIPGTTSRVRDGGAWRLSLDLSWRPADPPTSASRHHTASFEATAEDMRPDGSPIQLRVKAREEETLTVEPLPPADPPSPPR